jgi:hypothetical protein
MGVEAIVARFHHSHARGNNQRAKVSSRWEWNFTPAVFLLPADTQEFAML